MSEPVAGARLGAYVLVAKIGEGNMGVVYEGRHDVLGRRVAIKILRPERARDPVVLQRFFNEARAANAIRHENIVNVYDHGEGPEGPFIVMELLVGETLSELEARERRLTIGQIAAIFVPVLKALAAAHAAGVIHRDLKPPNVFLSRPAVPGPPLIKLLDFGVAKLGEGWKSPVLTTAGAVIGTPVYMSPEQIRGRVVDARSDLFSVGVMLYEALVGEVPFRAPTMAELAAQVVRLTPPPPAARAPGIPPALDLVVQTAMSKGPEKRYRTAVAMLTALEAALPAAPRVAPPIPQPKPVPPRPRRTTLWIGLALLAIAIPVGAVFALRGRPPAPAPPPAAPAPSPQALAAQALRDALSSPDLAEQVDAVAALDLAATPTAASLLYPLLGGSPELRRRSAHVLERLRVPEAAPRIRAVLDASGGRLRVELLAVLAALGDRDSAAPLRAALADEGTRLWAALGLAALGDGAAATPVLGEILDAAPRGRGDWLRAAEGLLALGDARATALLVEELAQGDADRAVGAAEALARRDQADGRAFLQRVVAQRGDPRRGAAAVALARAGDRTALTFVADGLASADAADRRQAAAVAGLLGERSFTERLATMSARDPDRVTRLTAAAALLGLGGAR